MLLVTHSFVRWAVLALAVVVLVLMLRGMLAKRAWTPADRAMMALYVGVLDLQLLLGFGLYAVSPLVHEAMQNVGGAMRDSAVRFFLVEHPLTMFFALAAAHVGNVIVKRAPTDAVRFRRALATVVLSLGLVLAGMPWSRLMAP